MSECVCKPHDFQIMNKRASPNETAISTKEVCGTRHAAQCELGLLRVRPRNGRLEMNSHQTVMHAHLAESLRRL